MRDLEYILKTCADKNRIRILKLLQEKKMCVCELAFVLGITQPSVSRHLKKLKKAGLVEIEQDSFWTNYFIKSRNSYAKTILSLLQKWLNEDKIVKGDLIKVKKADRAKLCCK
ncbi:MAG: metalloregulator ArsR/SmtB family transcription factor [Candidatus Omnitrophica bacterium]|nr:metalloregulator ArsR/SmtB family transcription factor [Candidatus Omnitrophota bacterium]